MNDNKITITTAIISSGGQNPTRKTSFYFAIRSTSIDKNFEKRDETNGVLRWWIVANMCTLRTSKSRWHDGNSWLSKKIVRVFPFQPIRNVCLNVISIRTNSSRHVTIINMNIEYKKKKRFKKRFRSGRYGYTTCPDTLTSRIIIFH